VLSMFVLFIVKTVKGSYYLIAALLS